MPSHYTQKNYTEISELMWSIFYTESLWLNIQIILGKLIFFTLIKQCFFLHVYPQWITTYKNVSVCVHIYIYNTYVTLLGTLILQLRCSVCLDNKYTISHWKAYNHVILFIYLFIYIWINPKRLENLIDTEQDTDQN